MSAPAKREVVEVAGREVAISNPGRCAAVPEARYTKLDVARYYWPWRRVRCGARVGGRTCWCGIRTGSARNSSTEAGAEVASAVAGGCDDPVSVEAECG